MNTIKRNLLCFMPLAISFLLISSCQKERDFCGNDYKGTRPPGCDTRVIFRGAHFCSGIKLQRADGTWLRAFGLSNMDYRDGEAIYIGYQPFKMEFDCQTFAELPPEDLGTPVKISCERKAEKN